MTPRPLLTGCTGALLAGCLLAGCRDRSSSPPPPTTSASTLSLEDQGRVTALANAGITAVTPAPAEPAALVELGRNLFFDKVLSGNRNIACASCHQPAAATGDGLPLALGEGASGTAPARTASDPDQVIPRNAPPLFHVGAAGVQVLFLDGRVRRAPTGALQTPEPALNGPTPARPDLTAQLTSALAAQAMFPVAEPAEMRGRPGENELADAADNQAVWAGIMARLVGLDEGTVGGIEVYRTLFRAAYPDTRLDDLTFAHAARALAAFESSAFAAFDSPLDQFLAGDGTALSDAAKRGLDLFVGPARCAQCHSGPLLSDLRFHALATPQLGPGKDSNGDDLGRALVTGDNRDDYRFRTAPLRNVALSAPFFHAGAFPDLTAVLRHYRDPARSLLNYDPTRQLPPFYRDLVDTDPSRNQARLAAVDPIVGGGIRINDGQIADLVAFLESLTDPAARTFSAPTSVPSGLPVAD